MLSIAEEGELVLGNGSKGVALKDNHKRGLFKLHAKKHPAVTLMA